VAANIVAMFLRGCYAFYFAAQYFTTRRNMNGRSKLTATPPTTSMTLMSTVMNLLYRSLPFWDVTLLFGAAYGATYWSRLQFETEVSSKSGIISGTMAWYYLAAQHVSTGLVSTITVFLYAYNRELEFRKEIARLKRAKWE
jgi:hypothetical protein